MFTKNCYFFNISSVLQTSVKMTYLAGHMYRQNSEKALLGGGGGGGEILPGFARETDIYITRCKQKMLLFNR